MCTGSVCVGVLSQPQLGSVSLFLAVLEYCLGFVSSGFSLGWFLELKLNYLAILTSVGTFKFVTM